MSDTNTNRILNYLGKERLFLTSTHRSKLGFLSYLSILYWYNKGIKKDLDSAKELTFQLTSIDNAEGFLVSNEQLFSEYELEELYASINYFIKSMDLSSAKFVKEEENELIKKINQQFEACISNLDQSSSKYANKVDNINSLKNSAIGHIQNTALAKQYQITNKVQGADDLNTMVVTILDRIKKEISSTKKTPGKKNETRIKILDEIEKYIDGKLNYDQLKKEIKKLDSWGINQFWDTDIYRQMQVIHNLENSGAYKESFNEPSREQRKLKPRVSYEVATNLYASTEKRKQEHIEAQYNNPQYALSYLDEKDHQEMWKDFHASKNKLTSTLSKMKSQLNEEYNAFITLINRNTSTNLSMNSSKKTIDDYSLKNLDESKNIIDNLIDANLRLISDTKGEPNASNICSSIMYHLSAEQMRLKHIQQSSRVLSNQELIRYSNNVPLLLSNNLLTLKKQPKPKSHFSSSSEVINSLEKIATSIRNMRKHVNERATEFANLSQSEISNDLLFFATDKNSDLLIFEEELNANLSTLKSLSNNSFDVLNKDIIKDEAWQKQIIDIAEKYSGLFCVNHDLPAISTPVIKNIEFLTLKRGNTLDSGQIIFSEEKKRFEPAYSISEIAGNFRGHYLKNLDNLQGNGENKENQIDYFILHNEKDKAKQLGANDVYINNIETMKAMLKDDDVSIWKKYTKIIYDELNELNDLNNNPYINLNEYQSMFSKWFPDNEEVEEVEEVEEAEMLSGGRGTGTHESSFFNEKQKKGDNNIVPSKQSQSMYK